MNTTLVVNAKGGVGKTTVATNLASYFAAQGVETTLADFDPQGSSLNWTRLRPAFAGAVAGVDLAQRHGAPLAAGRRQIPLDTQQLIIDAPAGPSRLLLQDLLARAPQAIVIPVAPSAIDVHATANFIRELLLVGHVRLRTTRVAVVANRISGQRPVYEPLERFASALKITFVARLSDSTAYVDAAESGLGIYDLPAQRCAAEQREFLPVALWAQGSARAAAPSPGNVVPLRPVTGAVIAR
jgi:chromosome partitioning protein